jgi:GGDEF domain-containing protein
LIEKVGVKNMPSTKIELNYNKISRMQALDELAKVLFPSKRNHQKIFLAIFIELKYAPQEFLPSLMPLCNRYGFTPRMLETVRSKMRRMGIIDHVSRFNKTYGHREGWVFSNRFSRALSRLAELTQSFKNRKDALQEQKDRDIFMYL